MNEGLDIPVSTPGAPAAATALERVASAVDRTGHAASGSADHMAKLSNAFNETYAAATKVAGIVSQLVTGTAALAAEQEHLDDMSHRLGLNFDDAASAAGRFTDEVDVMNTAGAFAARGIHLTQTELNAMTHAAARNAQQTGVETSQALNTLTEALIRGRARGLGPFGEELAATARNGYTLTEGLAALVAQEGHMETANDDARTSLQGLSDGFGDVARGTATWVANLIGLPSIIGDVSRAVSGLSADLAEVNRLESEARSRQAEGGARARAQAEFAAAQHRAGEIADRIGAPRSAIAVANVNSMSTAEIAAMTQRITAVNARLGATQGAGTSDIVERSLGALRPAAGSTVSLDTRAGGVDPFLASVTHTEQEIQRASRGTVISVERDRAELVAAFRDAGHELDAARAAEAARAAAAAAAERRARLHAGERDGGGGATGPTEAEARRTSEIAFAEKQRQADAAARAEQQRLAAEDTRTRAANAARVASELAVANDNARGKGAEQSRLNRLDEERSNSSRIRSFFAEQANAAVDLRKTVEDAYGAMTSAASAHFEALVTGQETAGAALQGFVHDTLAAWAKIAAQQAVMELGAGFASLFVNPAAAPAHFIAAGLYGVAAAATGGLAAATAPAAAGGGGGSGGSQRAASVGPQRSDGGGGGGMTIVQNYYAPTFGGREGTEAEIGVRLNRYDDAARARLRRAA